MKIFYKIILVIKIWRVKCIWNKFNKVSSDLQESLIKDKKFRKLFIIDEEDEKLNKKVLNEYQNNIDKFSKKKNKLIVSLNKKIENLGLFDSLLFIKFEKYRINPKNVAFLRDITKNYLEQKNK